MRFALLTFIAGMAFAAPPVINDLQPRGAQKGRPFVLTLFGRELGDGAKVHSTLPATFTPMAPEKTGPMLEGRYASFLVEPKESLETGIYPIRVETPDGISNIQLFTVGSFPEIAEEESRPGSLANLNDGIEGAQALPSPPVTVNGVLRGPERDLFRISAKAGEKRVFEVEARRIGSAIDPVIRVLDQSGKMLARSEDAALLSLDARVELTFPREGYYYVEVRDARFSTQSASYYRLKTGAYSWADEIFPLGGQRGQQVEVAAGARKVTADLRHIDAKFRQTFLNLPDGATLPIPFAVGDNPEVTEPATAALALPVTVNGRIAKAGEIDEYSFDVKPGEGLTFRMEARELGTSKLMAVITVRDAKGTVLGRSGDEPLPEDFFNVNQSRTAGDPSVQVEIPRDVRTVKVSVEDLALRGGAGYGYRLHAGAGAQDFRLTMNVPYLNIPAGGSVAVPVTMERFGYQGDVHLRLVNAPKGLKAEGGYIVAGAPVKANARNPNSRGVLILSSEEGASFNASELRVEGVGKLPNGEEIVRAARGLGMLVNVAGATQQGSVDRQRPITAPWLALDLPAAATGPKPATLEVQMVSRRRMEEGDEIKFRWKWHPRDASIRLPKTVVAEMVGAGDVRLIDAQQDPKDRTTGTFLMTTTKLTRPAKYDVYVTGRLGMEGEGEEVVSRPISVEVEEVKALNAENTSGR
ncbi:MAG: hypothetical protein SFV51_09185 [Bryobacteraceae bacterium]|nr:hypothetical protein [Bryobacteraceae bacterium]